MTEHPLGQPRVLARDDLERLMRALSAELARVGAQADMLVVGGAAIALHYSESRATRDVDAVFSSPAAVRRAAAAIAEEFDVEEGWLNDGAKGYLPGNDDDAEVVFESPSLTVMVASPRYLLAMKLFASRDERDMQDALRLCEAAGITTHDELRSVLVDHYGSERLLPRHQYILAEAASRLTSPGTARTQRLEQHEPSELDSGPARPL